MALDGSYSRADVKAGACSYLLLGLLQRMDAQRPGLLDELAAGVEGDLTAVRSQGEVMPLVSAIFQEAQAILRRAQGYRQPSPRT